MKKSQKFDPPPSETSYMMVNRDYGPFVCSFLLFYISIVYKDYRQKGVAIKFL